ncbi:MAG: hypothetical protein NZ521_09495, partial [Flammeovirgaceae bacterium]|nr:hypothetical protein [Flammeovirgaceae bacterium]MDW8288454.1 hypothetical protein [Flammeovirgaceae bacterium]
MTNKEIVRKLKWLLLLVELHQPELELLHFLPQQLLKLEKIQKPLESFTETDWEENGLNENVVDFVVQLVENHSLPLLEELQEQTPSGVLDMLKLRGLGAKKVRTLWKDLAIENLEELKKVALEGKITTLKGFGEKTQETILTQIDFFEKNAHKLLFADAERYAMRIIRHLYEHVPDIRIELCGELRRNCEVISCIELLISTAEVPLAFALIDELGDFSHNYQQSGVFVWRGMVKDNGCRVVVRAVELQRFANYLFSFSANHRHLSTVVGTKTLYEYAQAQAYSSEEKIYETAGLPFIAP